MKCEVLLTKGIIKDYYKDMFVSKLLFPLILILVIPAIGGAIFVINGNTLMGVSLLTIAIFTNILLIINYLKGRNNQIEIIGNRELIYYFDFDNKLKITINNNSKEFEYKVIKRNQVNKYFELIIKTKELKTIYIIPKYKFNIKEWSEIDKLFN